MAVAAYVFIQTETGRAFGVAAALRASAAVISADAVAGPYDVIVMTQAPSLDELGRLVVSTIQTVEGVTRTFTCPIVKL